jgi:hypothetical protein
MRQYFLPKFILALSLLLGFPGVSHGRVALVIGNGAYENVPLLPNPLNDAADVAASLRRLGFDVKTVTNGKYDPMRRAIIEFGQRAQGADVALIYFAGHGIQMGGENWIIPVDAQLATDLNVANEAIGLQSLTRAVSNTTKLGLVILDACRSNPFLPKMKGSNISRAVDRGLSRVQPSDNVLVAYSARDGTTASDGPGRNSPFTQSLLKHIESPGLEVSFLFRRVRDDVMQATKREQQPFVYGSLSDQAIYLGTPPAAARTPDLLLWEAIESSKIAAVFEEFLKRYPNSLRARDAASRIAELSKQRPSADKPDGSSKIAALPIAKPAAPVDNPGSAATMRGIPLIASEIPFICDKCRDEIQASMKKAKKHTALVLSVDGDRYWISGAGTESEARWRALGTCLGEKKLDCQVFSIDGRVVWDEPRPILPAKPWIRRDASKETPLDFQKVQGLSGFDRARLAASRDKNPRLAFAMGALGNWAVGSGGQSDDENARMALERCWYITRGVCQIVAINESLLGTQDPDLEFRPTAFKISLQTITQRLDPGQIPFVSDKGRREIQRAIESSSGHSALFISLEGGYWWSINQVSADDARVRALGACLASRARMCMLYAIDGQVIWRGPTPPLPSKPWFPADLQSAKALDIDKVMPRFSPSTRQNVRSEYLSAGPPKALAIGDVWAAAWSKVGQLASEEEAAREALERCGFLQGVPCRIVGINDKSVAK